MAATTVDVNHVHSQHNTASIVHRDDAVSLWEHANVDVEADDEPSLLLSLLETLQTKARSVPMEDIRAVACYKDLVENLLKYIHKALHHHYHNHPSTLTKDHDESGSNTSILLLTLTPWLHSLAHAIETLCQVSLDHNIEDMIEIDVLFVDQALRAAVVAATIHQHNHNNRVRHHQTEPSTVNSSEAEATETGSLNNDSIHSLSEDLRMSSSVPNPTSYSACAWCCCLPCSVWVSVARVHMQVDDLDAAEKVLHEALELCPLHDRDRTTALDTLERIGRRWEEREKEDNNMMMMGMDRAMTCYEIVLLQRSRLYGPTHIRVAESLINVARVMETTGNVEGSLDLYRAAQAIYSSQLTVSELDRMEESDIHSLLELFPTALEQGRYEEVIAYLSAVIEAAERQENETTVQTTKEERDESDCCNKIALDNKSNTAIDPDDSKALVQSKEKTTFDILDEMNRWKEPILHSASEIMHTRSTSVDVDARYETKKKPLEIDKTYIFYNLARAYIGLRDYVSATFCLLEAAKYKGQVNESMVFALLRRVEFLQREAHEIQRNHHNFPTHGRSHSVSSNSSGSLTEYTSSYRTIPGASSETDREGPVEFYRVDGIYDNPPNKSAIRSLPSHRRHSPARKKTNFTTLTCDSSCNSLEEEEEDYKEHKRSTCCENKSQSIVLHSDMSSSLFASEVLLSVDTLFMSDALRYPMVDAISHAPYSSIRKGRQIEILDGNDELMSLPSSKSEHGPFPWVINPADHGIFSPSRAISEKRLELNASQSPQWQENSRRLGEANIPLRPTLSNLSVRSKSLAKTLTSTFRRQRRSGNGYQNYSVDDLLDEPLAAPFLVTKSPSLLLPSEEDYHSTVEGPLAYVMFYTSSFDSCVSEITLRLDDSRHCKDTKQEWWWSVTTEGIARWFPTSYMSKAVEAAEGFLSAKSIHSKVASTPLEYISDEEDIEVEEDENSVEDKESYVDHPSYLGVTGNDSTTFLSGVDGRARAKLAEAKREAGKCIGPRGDGTLSGLSDARRRPCQELNTEIALVSSNVDTQRSRHGKMHPEVATPLFTLAVLHSRNGASAPAIEYAAEALGIQKAAGKFADACRSLHFLADVYLHQCQYSTALIFYTEALRIEKSHFGEVSDEAAMSLNCIGTVYALQNEFLKAMESHQSALRILYVVHDEDIKHPLISETLCQIGAVYYRERNSFSKSQGQGMTQEQYTTFVEAGMLETIGRAHEDRGSYKLAISFFEEKLQLMEAGGPVTDDDGLDDVAATLNSLGMLSSRAGFYVEAIDYYEKALNIQVSLGCDKVQFATARVLIGAVHFQLGDWQKALKLHQESLTALLKDLGSEHQTVAAALYQLGVVQAALCEYDTALNLLQQALGIQTRLLGVDQPASLRTRREIANIHAVYPSSAHRALDELDDVLACQRLIHGDRHPNIAETLHSIGRAYARANDDESALQILEGCYYMRTEFLGWDHPQQALTLHEICQLHLKGRRMNKALHIIDVVIGILRESFSDDHIEVALALSTKARCLLEDGKVDPAQSILQEALRIAETAVGSKHPSVADVLVHSSALQMCQSQWDTARNSIEQAFAIYRHSDVSDEYPGLVHALENLNRIENEQIVRE